ncbi:hypothetical protein DCC39_10365 [Pueribacillus theae]|uniref:MCM C-terminal AAA(+) ATPase domain-containing protein n=1 Tax=Pueribacillus theae TaxID=2171751 RepID=A0A2U1K280_9BACI|nr:toprim domain-containing protein [Pueribacillus theae]PWA11093.1 hypothetical protein DCC39_10365 [Pueribacillus theae]
MYADDFKALFPDGEWENSGNDNYLINCPFHDHLESKTLAIDFNSGLWVCKNPECGASGKGVKQLEQRMYRQERIGAFEEQISIGRSKLQNDKEMLTFLQNERGLNAETAYRYSLAVSTEPVKDTLTGVVTYKKYLLIPIFDRTGNIVSGRKYLLPQYREDGDTKIKFTWPKSPITLYPVSSLNKGTIVITEGELDALLLNQLGIPAVTSTGGSSADFKPFASSFQGKTVYICYDSDNAGKTGAEKVAKTLINQPDTVVYNIDLQLEDGEDVTDYFIKYKKTKDDFLMLMKHAQKIETPTPPELPMSHIGTKHINKQYLVEARVLGESGISKFLWNHHSVLECKGYGLEACHDCPLNEAKKAVVIEPNDPLVMELIEQTPQKQRQFIGSMAHIPYITNTKRCNFWKFSDESKQEIAVPIFIESADENTPEAKRELAGYVTTEKAASSIKSGHKARFWLTPVQETRNNGQLMFIAEEAIPLQDDLDTFKMTEKLHARLKVFQGNPFQKIPEITSSLNKSIYRIRGREDLVTAYDLVYHSVLGIPNPNAPNRIVKGWVELLVIGDPGEGKSQLAMEMQRYYDLGAIQDAATATPGGLTVTTVQMGGKWIFRDGLLPLNDRRLVFIDEFNKLHAEDMGRLNTSRSSGSITASSSAGTYEKDARVRLVWITNPRDGQRINMGRDAGEFPIKMVPELFPDRGSQDRLDFAVLILQVDDKPEFTFPPADKEDPVYTKELCRSLILWAWTRRPDQIKFTKDAVKEIRLISDQLRRTYWHADSDIELINSGERTTERIMRLSAAAAARTYSTADGENLFITPEHVQFVKQFLENQYGKMEYGEYIQSIQMRQKARIIEEAEETPDTEKTIEQVAEAQVYQLLIQDRLFKDMLTSGMYDISLERKLENRNVLGWLYTKGYVRTDDARHFKFTKAFYQELEPRLGNIPQTF